MKSSDTKISDLDAKIIKTLKVPDAMRDVVLVDFLSNIENLEGNIFVIDSDGSIKERLSTGRAGDSFVGVKIESGVIVANTWDGFSIKFDPLNFQKFAEVFVK